MTAKVPDADDELPDAVAETPDADDQPLDAAAGTPNADDQPIDRSPARASSVVAVGAIALAFAAVGTASVIAFSLCAIGTATVVGGILTRNRGVVTAGSAILFVGTLAAGVADASAPRLLIATGGTVFGWDVGRTAIDIGSQLGADADTTALERRHAGASLLVIVGTGVVGYTVFWVAEGRQPAVAVIALLVAGALLSLTIE